MKKRYFHEITSWDLPKKTERSIYLGKIAETKFFQETEAFLPIDELTKHMIIAGSTGGGKTVTAQVIAEEAIAKGISIVVVDPTAQWTGFIRELDEPSIKKKYDDFGIKKDAAKAYLTRIISMNNNYDPSPEIFDKETITILEASQLSEKELDTVITKTISMLFKNTPQESQKLKSLLFFEEIHRILPKYGGTGAGLVALERAVREFRKWGIGIVLISQVLEDFVGEIRANIGTEMQLRTAYELDLDKIRLKYGDEIAKSVMREETGTVMIHNSNYNLGKPFFILVRPPYHDIHRLSPKELSNYASISKKISEIEKRKITQQDAFTLKLTKKELSKANFKEAELYINELLPKKKK